MTSLENKIVFITGASSGIGKSCAIKFANAGAKLILTARRKERLNELSNQLKNDFGTSSLILNFNIKSYEVVKEAVASIPNEWKMIDILINNAGLGKGLNKIHEGSVDDWEEMIDTNFKGLLYVTRELLPTMVERKSGHIINIGSVAGHEVYPAGNIYCATKFAVNAISKALRIDLLDKYVKVSSVDPGLVETEFSIVRYNGDVEKAKNVYRNIVPLTPDDIADAVLFCATRPHHVNINEIILTPLAQASPNFVHRES